MFRRPLLFLVALFAAVCAALALPSSVSAHNTLLASDPVDGATLDAAPSQIVWSFENSVPLDTVTITLIDAAGARSELPGSTHGATDAEVVTPLPELVPGEISLRWRLVGSDGHAITGRIDFTLAAPASATAVAPTTVAGAVAPLPTVAPPSTTVSPVTAAVSERDVSDGSYSTPGAVRWFLRYSSYLAIMTIVGTLWTTAHVWSGAGRHALLRQLLRLSLLATAGLGFLQLLVVASDISGNAPWAALGSVGPATSTYAGMGFALRMLLAGAMWVLLFRFRLSRSETYWAAVSIASVALLGTWASAGHSQSMRWPEIGVLADVAHHGAAAAWIAGLAIVGLIVIPSAAPDVVVRSVKRFSRTAAVSVAVLVGTGLIQALRLVGSPGDLLDANHGRYLAVKLVALVAMLALANVNRRRASAHLEDPAVLNRHLGPLQRAIAAEFAIGLLIIGITAAMVVSSPSTNNSESVGRAPSTAAAP